MNLKLKLSNLLFFFCFAYSVNTFAHAPDHSYLYLRIYEKTMGGRFEMTAKDMNKALGLNLEDKLTYEAIQPFIAQVQAYLKSRSNFQSTEGDYSVSFTETTVLNLEEMEDFVRFNFDLEGVKKIPAVLEVDYTVLFDKNPKHRGMCIFEYNWKAGILDNEALVTNIFSPESTHANLSLTDVSLWKGFVALVKLGIWHIWIGLDHILFILALILPAVVRRKRIDELDPNSKSEWVAVDKFKPAFIYIIKIITFFTVAHSITLALAAMDIINLPSRFVESIIAISIALAAYHNINPILKNKEWLIAFGFGLFHGFGFASVLGEKGLGGDFMVLSLFGFNVGVEIGQLLIISMIFPILFLIRKSGLYKKIIFYGSILLIFISIHWFIERSMGINLRLGDYFLNFYHSLLG